MTDQKPLFNIRYVVDSQGKPSAVQLDLAVWDGLIAYLENLEDRSVVREKLSRLLAGPEKSGAVAWDEVRQAW
jgi:hypothetical protein